MFFRLTDKFEIYNLIAGLPNKKSIGFDNFNVEITWSDQFKSVAQLININFLNGKLPEMVKKFILPIFKSGKLSEVTDQFPYYNIF